MQLAQEADQPVQWAVGLKKKIIVYFKQRLS